jgi:iron-sulfur cluster assembly accessory protein
MNYIVNTTFKFDNYIKDVLEKNSKNYTGVIITMLKEGSCGLSYKVKLYSKDINPIDFEEYIKVDKDFDFFVDKKILPLIEGSEIDYVRGIKSGIVFKNPNESKSCGCGSAFKFKKPENEKLEINLDNKCA